MAMQAAPGWKVFCIDGVPWCRYGVATAMTIPLPEVHPVGWSHAERILRESGCLLALFPTSVSTGVVCAQHVLRDKHYGEASLQRQFRQMLRRGERHLVFRELTWDELGGFEIFWRRPGGYRSVCTVVYPGFFRCGAANLLLYRSARALIARSDCEYVNFGRSGIPAIEGHDRFHRHAGLTEQPLRMAAFLHPRLRWLGRIAKSIPSFATLRAALGSQSRIARHLEARGARCGPWSGGNSPRRAIACFAMRWRDSPARRPCPPRRGRSVAASPAGSRT